MRSQTGSWSKDGRPPEKDFGGPRLIHPSGAMTVKGEYVGRHKEFSKPKLLGRPRKNVGLPYCKQ